MATESSPRATILIATTGDKPSLREALGILRGQANATDSELLVVVNGESERLSAESRSALEQLCDRIDFASEPGKSFALNRGLSTALGEVVAFTDDDTLPQPSWVATILEVLTADRRDERLVAVGGPVIPIFEPDVPEWFRETVHSRPAHYLGPRHDHGPEPFDYPIGNSPIGGVPYGANFAVRRDALGELRYPTDVGPSQITGLRGGEDTVFEQELLRRGWRIRYEPRAVVHHPVSSDRATLEFAVEASRNHGRESVIVRRTLGLTPPTRLHLIRKLLKLRLVTRFKRRDDLRTTQYVLRTAELRGMLDGLS